MTLHISAFFGSEKSHGGTRRSRQLVHSAILAGQDVISFQDFVHLRASRLRLYPLATLRICPLIFKLAWQCLSLQGIAALLLYIVPVYVKILQLQKGDPVNLEICPGTGVLMGNVLALLGIPFNAYPHNIEFLVPGQKQSFFRGPVSEYLAERRVYNCAQKVFTISKYDASIIASMGQQNVETLAYAPHVEDRPFWDIISLARSSSSKTHLLILGTVSNPPTLLGLQRLLRLIEQDSMSSSKKFVLVGFGTSALSGQVPSSVELAGEVSEDRLQALMINAKGIVLWQPPTSGMLTRLVEACQAGIPCFVFGGYYQALEMNNLLVRQVSSLAELPD